MTQPTELTTEDLLMFLALAVDRRTCLLIGEIVKDGKRHEIVHRRAESMLTVHDDALAVLSATLKTSGDSPALTDPDEIVVRILRPQREG